MKCFHRFDVSYQHQSQFSKSSSVSGGVFRTTSHVSLAYIASLKDVNDTSLFLDSGATHHVANSGDSLLAKAVYFGHGGELPITHVGNSDLPYSGTSLKSLTIRNIILVPSITKI